MVVGSLWTFCTDCPFVPCGNGFLASTPFQASASGQKLGRESSFQTTSLDLGRGLDVALFEKRFLALPLPGRWRIYVW